MLSREQSISNFIKNCDDLISSNYILASKKISILLKSISSSKIFVELFEFVTDGFDFDEAQKRAINEGTSYGRGKFIMPKDSRSIIAFVFLLLCQIDLKERDFLKLLETCFLENGYNESFKIFAKEVIVPFKNETLAAIKQMIEGVVNYNPAVVSVKKAEKPVLTDEQSNTIKTLLNESKAIILQYKMEPKLKAELLALYDNFSSALNGTSANKLKLAFLGYKYSTLYHRKLDVGVNEIEKILLSFGILDENY